MKKTLILALGLAAPLLSVSSYAKVSEEQAARLGADLSPIGGEMAGNAEGTIPPLQMSLPKFPQEALDNPSKHLPNPYADEKPIVVLTAENYEQHADKLTEGQIALFKKFPETFKMKVYPSHRHMGFSDFIYKSTKENATRAVLAGDEAFLGAYGGVPFPIPQNGLEAIWNHIALLGPYSTEQTSDSAAVWKSGRVEMGRDENYTINTFQNPNSNFEEYEQSYKYGLTITTNHLPKKKAGEITLVHEPLGVEEDRKAWTYSPGIRRVRRAPVVAFDFAVGPGGMFYADEGRMFAGSPVKYEWKLLGKVEKYTPFNNYDMDSPELTYDEILTPGHVNPEPMRYELHRLWKVEATLKDSERHVIGKRVLYLGEDSWMVQLADAWDNRENLWRTSMRTMIFDPHFPGLIGRTSVFYDLISGDYSMQEMNNEQDKRLIHTEPGNMDKFTPNGMRRQARR